MEILEYILIILFVALISICLLGLSYTFLYISEIAFFKKKLFKGIISKEITNNFKKELNKEYYGKNNR